MLTRQIEGSDSSPCVVLVLSCYAHRDLWTPFFTLFKHFWPDCAMPVYLGSDSAGEIQPWSTRLRIFLESLSSPYVLLMLEDFFLDRPVCSAAVDEQIRLLHSLQGVSIRLFPNPPADYFRDGVGVIHANAAYRVSLQASIWNRARLLGVLVDGESPWEFEWRGSVRSRDISGFYCVKEPVIHYRHVVERGEWFRHAARFYAAQNIGCDFAARPVMGLFQTGKKMLSNTARRLGNRARSTWLRAAHPENTRNAC